MAFFCRFWWHFFDFSGIERWTTRTVLWHIRVVQVHFRSVILAPKRTFHFAKATNKLPGEYVAAYLFRKCEKQQYLSFYSCIMRASRYIRSPVPLFSPFHGIICAYVMFVLFRFAGEYRLFSMLCCFVYLLFPSLYPPPLPLCLVSFIFFSFFVEWQILRTL